MCRVLNKHHHGVPAGAIYIGRGSKRGNPFRIGPDGDRETVMVRHAAWLREQHHLLRALDELRGKDLVCFCAARACHGDLLRRLANADRQRGSRGGAGRAEPRFRIAGSRAAGSAPFRLSGTGRVQAMRGRGRSGSG
jgi:hypothetical protein